MKTDYYRSLFFGFYGVCVKNGFSDGFINKCRFDNLPLWNIRSVSHSKIYFCVPCEYIEPVRENAEFSGMEAEITGEFGFIPFLKKHRCRAFLLVGVFLSLIFTLLMSGRIWNIQVSGNDKVFESEILAACSELGLSAGTRKKDISVSFIQQKLTEMLDERLMWTSVNIEGMCAEVIVREAVRVEDDVTGEPCNYVADFDGVIKICRVYSGTAEAKKGDGVHKGDLLISGVIEYETGESEFTEARGKITAEHQVEIKSKAQKSVMVRRYIREKSYYTVELLGHEINPFKSDHENCEITKSRKALCVEGVILPFAVNKYTSSFYEYEEAADEDFLQALCLENYLFKVRESFSNSRVLSLSEKKSGTISGKFECIDYIGKKSVILLENE